MYGGEKKGSQWMYLEGKARRIFCGLIWNRRRPGFRMTPGFLTWASGKTELLLIVSIKTSLVEGKE